MMKRKILYGAVFLGSAVLFCMAVRAEASHQHQLQGAGEKRLFTKHFENTIFDITEHAEYSVEVLLDDREYSKLGKNVIGLVIHNAHDEDVVGASISIGMKIPGGNEAEQTYNVTDKGGGLYTVSGLDLQRPGKWELTIGVKKNGIADSVKFALPEAIKNRVPKGKYSP